MKKVLSMLLVLLMLAVLFVGCGSEDKPAETKSSCATESQTQDATESQGASDSQTPDTTEAPAPEAEGIFITVNGVDVTVGVPFADLEEALGAPIAPADTMDSCDEGSDWKQTMHYYAGVIITENKDGVIDGVQVSDGDAALMGKLRIGATKDEVVALLGTPDTDESWGIYYMSTSPMINFYLDETTGLISGFALMGMD